uniref:Uncharacterized protein n=1 Tax=Tetranychus urticae TaxID=32264 RepID=T1K2D7_TETUR
MKVIVLILISLQVYLGSSQQIDFYSWSQVIDENLIDDFYHYINKFRIELPATCISKMLQRSEYAECYYGALDRWRTKTDQDKLACCFILDYEYCMLNLIKSECGRYEELKYRSTDGYAAAKRHIISIFNCHHRYDDIDDCRLPTWAIILISITTVLLFIIILTILKCCYNRKQRKLNKHNYRNVHSPNSLNSPSIRFNLQPLKYDNSSI